MHRTLLLAFITLFITNWGCTNPDKQEVINTHSKIDYKQNIYKLFLGQSKDSVQKIIQLHHNGMLDDGDSIKTYEEENGSFKEGFTKITMTDTIHAIPTLYFSFKQNRLIGFEYSVNLYNSPSNNIHLLLDLLKPYFNKLMPDSNRQKLLTSYSVHFDTDYAEEKFHLDTLGPPHGSFIFSYELNLK